MAMASNDDTDRALASRVALKGAIGQALQDALEDLAKDEEHLALNNIHHDISESFARAIASTPWKQAPPAQISGRLDHYNRFQGQWRIVVDSGAELVAPSALSKKKTTTNPIQLSEPVVLTETLQLLVYNDL